MGHIEVDVRDSAYRGEAEFPAPCPPAGEEEGQETQRRQGGAQARASWLRSLYGAFACGSLPSFSVSSSSSAAASCWQGSQRWLLQLRVLFWRETLVALRNPADVAGRMLLFVWIALLSNVVVYGVDVREGGFAQERGVGVRKGRLLCLTEWGAG